MTLSDIAKDMKKSLFGKKSDDYVQDSGLLPPAEEIQVPDSKRDDEEAANPAVFSPMDVSVTDHNEGFMQKMENLSSSKKALVALGLATFVAGTVYGVKTKTATGNYTLNVNLAALKSLPVIGQYIPITQSQPQVTAQAYEDLAKAKHPQSPPVVVNPSQQSAAAGKNGSANTSSPSKSNTPRVNQAQPGQAASQQQGLPTQQAKPEQKQANPTPTQQVNNKQNTIPDQKAKGQAEPKPANNMAGMPQQPTPTPGTTAPSAAPTNIKLAGIFPPNPFIENQEDGEWQMTAGGPGQPLPAHTPGGAQVPPSAKVPPVPNPVVPGTPKGSSNPGSDKGPMNILGITQGADGNNIAIMGDGKVLEIGDKLGSGEIAYIGGDGISLDNGTEISFDTGK